MRQIETTNRLIDAVCSAQGRLANVKAVITAQKEETQLIIDRFSKDQRLIIDGVQNDIKNEQSKAIFDAYQKELQSAVAEQSRRYQEYINGVKFITTFDESFIVCVFGKVKSGKSFLGNYIMGNAFKKNGIATKYDELGKLQVTVYDKGKISKSNELAEYVEDTNGQFKEGINETTSTIQYFQLGGLTWFDTPGIGSITKENEELAEEYIKNADLVVFAMNSDAAGTRQELQEMRSLHKIEKPILLLVTQSDTADWDIDTNGALVTIPVPKSQKDRDDVERYLLDTLQEMGISEVLQLGNNKVLTISAKLACDALTGKYDSEKCYEGSNMDAFINRLIDITTSEAANLKEQNPKSRFNGLISELMLSVDSVNKTVGIFREETRRIRERADEIKMKVIGNVRFRATGIIHEKVLQAASKIKSEDTKKHASDKSFLSGLLFGRLGDTMGSTQEKRTGGVSGEELAKSVSVEINKIIEEECINGLKELIPDIGGKNIGNLVDSAAIQLDDMKEKTVDASYQVPVTRREQVDRFFVVDLFFGKKYETVTEMETRNIIVSVGNNAGEIEDQLLNYFEGTCNRLLNEMIERLIEGCVEPLETIYTEFTKLIELTKRDLNGLTMK